MKVIYGFVCFCLTVVLLEASPRSRLRNQNEVKVQKFPNPIKIGVVEDHPWVIYNKTCLNKKQPSQNSCFTGLLIDLIGECVVELRFNYTIKMYGKFGSDNSSRPSKLSGVKGAIINKNVDMALVMLNVTEETKKVMDFTYPIVNNVNKTQTLAIGFPKGSALTSSFDDAIRKLTNQRHIDQMKENWFQWIHACKKEGTCQTEKQLTPID